MKRYWPVAVISLVGVAFSANLLLLYLAASDPGFGVEPDYYAKALAWDDRRAQERHNDSLGWTLDLAVDPVRAADGSQRVEVRLLDAGSQPIGDASINLTAFHNARSADLQHAQMNLGEDGTYAGTLRFHRPGLWEFRFEARRGSDVFTKTLLEDVWGRPLRPAQDRRPRPANGRP